MENYTGKRLDGRYEIQEVIGVGGMAVVYKAYDNIDDRIVAVKILKDEYLANEEFRRRFKNESKAISLLSHPNIVKVYNVNYGDRLQYIVMEYVEGITLKEYIEQQGKLGIKETIHFSMQILRALQHAHDKGIIHRDIKPQNILLLSNGSIKVTDFGIARFSYSDTKTMTDSAIGSVHYISPEQARGNSIDERTDIYSVGVVMYEMLTGTLPFVSDNSVSVALMQLQNDARSIREINPNIPEGLEQIVKRAMEKNTKARYQTASEMLLDIEEFKRNPNVKFHQNYFVDSEPTKFATNARQVPVAPVVPPVTAPVIPPVSTVAADEDDEFTNKGKAGFIIIGLVVGLLILVIAAAALLFIIKPKPVADFCKEKLPWVYETFFVEKTVTVPDFVNLNYDEDVLNNTEYDAFTFEISEQEDQKYADGTIIEQTPKADREIDPDATKIVLTVARVSLSIEIPDLTGKTCEEAEKELEELGFKVISVPSASTKDYGTVIETKPKAGESAKSGDTVVISYASDDEYIEVPDVSNLGVSEAKEKLESMGLGIEENYETEPSDTVKKGLIVSQSPAVGEKVLSGRKIEVTVSSGPENKSATVYITLPKVGENTSLKLDVYMNNESVSSKTVLMDGSSYSITVSGDKNTTGDIKVLIDGQVYYTCTAYFNGTSAYTGSGAYTNSPYEPYQEPSTPEVTTTAVPDVKGKTETEARTALTAAGFNNVETEYQRVYIKTQDGVVISQSPDAESTSTTPVATSTTITITIGQYEGI